MNSVTGMYCMYVLFCQELCCKCRAIVYRNSLFPGGYFPLLMKSWSSLCWFPYAQIALISSRTFRSILAAFVSQRSATIGYNTFVVLVTCSVFTISSSAHAICTYPSLPVGAPNINSSLSILVLMVSPFKFCRFLIDVLLPSSTIAP